MRQLSTASKNTDKRKRQQAFWKRPAFKPLAISALMGISAALITYSVKTGISDMATQSIGQGAINATAASGFILKDVFVEGREQTPLQDLRAVANLELDQPILDIDPQVLRERIEALPWVASASVERQLPDLLHITLNEHRPIALWQHDGTFSLINGDGSVILTGGHDIKVFAHLPLIVGEGAPVHAKEILKLIASEPDLQKNVKAAVRVSDRRWDIAMKEGMMVRLPEINAQDAWARLARYQKENEVFQQKLTNVDMRLADRVLVRMEDKETMLKVVSGEGSTDTKGQDT